MSRPDGSETAVESSQISALYNKLDALWETHLDLLDQYQKAQAEMQKHLSQVGQLLQRYDASVSDNVD